jgi:peptidoglycan/LPS O-acetylase OafA/YrhL
MPLSALAGVGLVIGILGWARRHFAGEGRLHAWARERAFGVYLIHQACVVAVAAVVVGTSWPIAVKFSVTLLAAAALTLSVNEVLRRIDWLAPAFGRDRRRVTQPAGTSGRRSARTPR